jgi:catechol 2,3-dioxygenase-like lactoylglutathione lyase family enzyme
MMDISVSIDVPDLEQGVRFYTEAFGFSKLSEPYPGVVVLKAADIHITLLHKGAQTKPSPHTDNVRNYARHWTPVHLDVHVDDMEVALAKALKAGATKELFFENPEHGSAAFCADPFGHGFCILERRRPKETAP